MGFGMFGVYRKGFREPALPNEGVGVTPRGWQLPPGWDPLVLAGPLNGTRFLSDAEARALLAEDIERFGVRP